jgi:hypothetical protein
MSSGTWSLHQHTFIYIYKRDPFDTARFLLKKALTYLL